MLAVRNLVASLLMLTILAFPPFSICALATSENGTGPSQAELAKLVSPIALYPDSLVALILAASTHPTDIVEAARFVKDHPALKGTQLAKTVDQQPWDPSVKSLTQFPSVLANMNKNLSWTSALGDAYYNEPQAVMKEIQVLRREAHAAGNLKTTPQQVVTESGQTIIIKPANPQIIYVPQYNPTVVYGAPVEVYPGYSSADMMMTSMMSFGMGMMVGSMMTSSWGCNWGSSTVVYNHNTYVSNTNNFYNHDWSNQNWNNHVPPPNYNSWTNNLKDQNWSQDKSEFDQSHPTWAANDTKWQQSHPNWQTDSQQDLNQFRQNHPDWGKDNPETSSGDLSDTHSGWDNGWNNRYRDDSGGSGGGLFGGSRFGGGSFVDSARGRWSSGGFGRF